MVLGIFGAGGLGREILETAKLVNEQEKKYEKIIFIVDDPKLESVQGIEVLGLKQAALEYEGRLEVVLAVGEPMNRRKIIARLDEMGLCVVSLIHPSVSIPDTTTIGKGCYIAAGDFISCNVTIGDYVLIQPTVNIGHDCVIADNAIICGMTTLGGNCKIGENTFLAMGVSVIQGCKIGKNTIISLGSAVYRDVPDEVIASGNPARPMRKNEEHRVFK